ncbi:MAG TPA: sugar phosphate nucleotidyltransferase [Nitrospiraceae bacterium]|nr:sugar phosphate nucleotidyltransferase [Nitrospiraceae bacterium]
MNTTMGSLWGIVLAGGDGLRLKEFVREHTGTEAPKQFCALIGTRTMLERTVRRARLLIPSERLVVVGTAHHRRYMFQSFGKKPPGSVLFQPLNRDTAPGILFPLVHILRRDPYALVAIFPSDHFVLPGRRLMRAVGEATDFLVRTRSDSPIVLAVEPTSPEVEYGWMKLGPSILSDGPTSICHVDRFVEKPSEEAADVMLQDGWLWNTMVFVSRAASLMELFREAVPDLVAYFEMLQRYVGDAQEHEIANEVYRMIPTVNFAATVLARQFSRLLVLPTTHVQWSDWGKKERILQAMFDLGQRRYPSVAAARAGLVFSTSARDIENSIDRNRSWPSLSASA